MSDGGPGFLLRLILTPFSWLYSLIMSVRNSFYDRGWLKAHPVGARVISIGNLTSGGTGKTPITSFLAEELVYRDVTVGIVSRGYGGEERGPASVPSDGTETVAARFGDEPSWLAAKHPMVQVVIGADRVAAAKTLSAQRKVGAIIADDAFQHRRLEREVDVVVIDATEPRWHYCSLPLGRMREGFSSLKRADYVFLSKINLGTPEDVLWLRERIELERLKYGFEVVEFESEIVGYAPLDRSHPTDAGNIESLEGMKVLLASGIGRASTFETLVLKSGAPEIVGHQIYRDHHAFGEYDRTEIERAAEVLKADAIIVTEKDAIKLRDWRPSMPCLVSRLESRPGRSLEKLFAEFS